MSLPFLKSDFFGHLVNSKDTPAETPSAAQRPILRTVSTTTAGAALAKNSKEQAEAAVKARLAALKPQPQGKPVKIVADTITVPRFAKTMRERLRSAQYEKTKGMVGQIEQFEIDQLIELAAKTRGRYISKLLEFGRATRPLSFTASEEVKGLREQHEEIVRGLDLIREALERGEIEVEGVEPF